MTDFLSLLKDTGAYKIVKGDKESNRLSHAYLIISPDQKNLKEILKVFAKLILCKQEENPCGKCRTCTLIDSENFCDALFYPKGNSITAEEVTSLIEESFVKPIESDKKLFILSNVESMNATAQNKLLKTLEEPPKNVHILLGSTSEFPLLSTILSRVKKLEIPAFSEQKLISALESECDDEERLLLAVSCADGTVGNTLATYNDKNLQTVTEYVEKIFNNLASSKNVLEFVYEANELKITASDILPVLELALRDLLVAKLGKEQLVKNKLIYNNVKGASGFSVGAITHILDKVEQAYKRKKANANAQMLLEWLLFQILEAKFKWQKL